jgi:hypothetical protein
MPSFTFKVGSLDWSSYMRVGPDDGMDPYGEAFMEPQFQSSSGFEGDELTSIGVHNRAQSWPVFLKGANKDLLHDLVISFNREAAAAGGKPLIEWKDAGATASSFYDSEFVRFDPDYSFRRGEKGYLAGFIRVWTQPPYAHTNTQTAVSTALGTSGQLVATVRASTLDGDVNGLVQYTVNTDGQLPGAAGRAVVLARMDTASYKAFWPAVDLAPQGNATLYGGSGAPGSQFWGAKRYPVTPSTTAESVGAALRVDLAGAVYAGRVRLLAAVRPGAIDGMYVWSQDPRGKPLSPTQLVLDQRNSWKLVDLGAFSVPSAVPTTSVAVGWGRRYYRGSFAVNTYENGMFSGGIAALYTLPEDTTAIHVDELAEPQAGGFMAASGINLGQSNDSWTDDYGNSFTVGASGLWFARHPDNGLQAATSSQLTPIMFHYQCPVLQDMRAEMLVDVQSSGNFNQFVTNVASAQIWSIGKFDVTLGAGGIVVGQVGLHATLPYLNVLWNTAGASAIASVALPVTSVPNGTRMGLLELVVRGDDGYANWRVLTDQATYGFATDPAVACVGFTASVLRNITGIPYIQLNGTAGCVPWYQFDRLLGRTQPSDAYTLDGIVDQVLIQGPSYGTQERTHSLRGKIPQAPPTGARFAAIVADLDGGSLQTAPRLGIAVRERFFLAR